MPTNCADLPNPKSFKPGAKLRLDVRRLRPNLAAKTPMEIRGKHVEMAFDTDGYRPTCFASNQHNELQALKTRVLCDTVRPPCRCPRMHGQDKNCTRTVISECTDWAKQQHRVLFPNMHQIQSVPFEDYLRRSNASPSVKRILKKTMEELKQQGIDESTGLTPSQLYQWTKRSSFVKVENDLYSSPLGSKSKAPRLIQGAQPEFICLVGPWIMALQDLVKRRWSVKKHFICFTSGVTAKQAAEFVNVSSGLWLEDDLAKFDATIRREWCEYEVWLCKKFGAPRAVIDLMSANISTHGSTHHGWRYKCDGTRKSGDPYTSVMNSIINGVSHVYLYCHWTGIDADRLLASDFRMLVQGDDNCMRHPGMKKFPWAEGMATLGFESEAIYRARLQEVEFCSSRIYEGSAGVTFGPKPGRVLAKLGYIINPPQGVSRESMMRGVALGLKTTAYFIPPLKSVIDRTLQLTEGHEAWFERKQFEAFSKPSVLQFSTLEVMASLNHTYDWDFGTQHAFNSSVEKMQFGDQYSPIATLLLDYDCGGPQQIFGKTYPTFVAAAA